MKRFYDSDSTTSGLQQVDKSKLTHRPAKFISARTKKRLVRRLIVISIFALAFIVFWLFLRYLTADKNTSQDSGAVRACSHYGQSVLMCVYGDHGSAV